MFGRRIFIKSGAAPGEGARDSQNRITKPNRNYPIKVDRNNYFAKMTK